MHLKHRFFAIVWVSALLLLATISLVEKKLDIRQDYFANNLLDVDDTSEFSFGINNGSERSLPTLHNYWQCNEDEKIPSIFSTPNCLKEFLRQQKRQSSSEYLIPPIRHVMWKDEKISAYMTKHVMSWQRIHPDWMHVLWRDQDFEPFLQEFFPGRVYDLMKKLAKYNILKVSDLMRFAILLKFGGVYADLDFTLVSDINEFRRLPALVIREPEVNSIGVLGLEQWPPKLLLMNSFMMAMPGHRFMDFCLTEVSFADTRVNVFNFAGPLALTRFAEKFLTIYPVPNSQLQTVYIPSSYSFNSYPGNSLKYISKEQRDYRLSGIRGNCKRADRIRVAAVDQLCKDPMNLDSIIDSSVKIYAVHDYNKSASVHSIRPPPEYFANTRDIRETFSQIKMASDLFYRAMRHRNSVHYRKSSPMQLVVKKERVINRRQRN